MFICCLLLLLYGERKILIKNRIASKQSYAQ